MGGTDREKARWRKPVAVAVFAIVVVLASPFVLDASRAISAFFHGTTVPPDGYEAVPNAELFRTIRALPEVRSASLDYVTNISSGDFYEGQIYLRPGLSQDVVDSVRDRVVIILLHGKYKASIGPVDVVFAGSPSLSVDRDFSTFDAASATTLLGLPEGRVDWPPQLAAVATKTTSSRPAFCAPYNEREPLCFQRISGLAPRHRDR